MRRRPAVMWRPIAVAAALGVLATIYLAHDHAAPPWWTNTASIHRGARDFATGSCISCHTIAGVSSAGAAIDLTHEGSRRSEPFLLHELAHPTSIRPPVPTGQLRDLVAYLSSLK